MAMYAAGNIAIAVDNFKSRGYARLSGIILNKRNVEDEEEKVRKLADDIDSKVVAVMERSPLVQDAEALGSTVVSAFPDSEMAKHYTELAEIMLKESDDDQ